MRASLLALSVLTAAFAGQAFAASKSVEVGAFTSVDAANGVLVELRNAPDPGVTLEGPPKQIERLSVTVNDGVLRVRPRSSWGFGNDLSDVVVRVQGPAIAGVKAANGARVTLNLGSNTPMTMSAENGGLINATGRCSTLEARVARGGLLEAQRFICLDVSVEAEMGGSAEVYAGRSLEAKAAMGGLVEVKGAPASRNTDATMGGAIEFNEG